MSASVGGGAAVGGISTAMIVTIGAIVAVALVAIAATVVVVTSSGGPTGTVKNFLQSVANDRPGSAFNDTIWSLNKSLYPLWVHQEEFDHSENESLTIHNLTEVSQAQMTVHQRDDMNETAHAVERVFNVTVQDFCFVKFNITIKTTEDMENETHNLTGQFSLVKVNGSWLIVLEFDELEEDSVPSSMIQCAPVRSA